MKLGNICTKAEEIAKRLTDHIAAGTVKIILDSENGIYTFRWECGSYIFAYAFTYIEIDNADSDALVNLMLNKWKDELLTFYFRFG